MSVEFRIVYPNQYESDEQELVDITRDFVSGDVDALTQKIEKQSIDQANGVDYFGGMELNPGIGLIKDRTLGSNDLLSGAYALNPYNPLYTDVEYAKNTRYGRLVANPLQVDIGPSFPYIPKGTDLWISNDDFTIGRGLDHEMTYYKPILVGDTIYSKVTKQDFIDVTEGGSTMRKFRVIGECELYNQNDEKVAGGWYSAIETFKVPVDRKMAEEYEGPRVIAFNKHANWDKIRPRHVYTDEDWEYMKRLWENESIRGAETLYWEDVNIGDEPIWTCEAPMNTEDGERARPLMEVGRNTFVRDKLLGTKFPITGKEWMQPPTGDLYKDEYGRYHFDILGRGFNPRAGVADHPNARSSFQNTIGRNFCTRLVTNWMGDDGFLHKMCWKLAFCYDAGENVFPAEHDRPGYLLKVPYLREQGKYMNTHGFEGDCSITKAYVCDKYIKDGKHYVDLVVWCETIEGDIWCECYAVVELPVRG